MSEQAEMFEQRMDWVEGPEIPKRKGEIWDDSIPRPRAARLRAVLIPKRIDK